MKRILGYLLLVAAINATVASYSQTARIDSLKRQILRAGSDQQKLAAILRLCDQGYTLHPDTLMAWAQKAAVYAQKVNDNKRVIESHYYRSYAFTNKGMIDSALAIADECLLALDKTSPDPVLTGKLLNQKGRCFMRTNKYKEAIDLGYQVISNGEAANDTLLQMQGKTLIGWAYLEMDQTVRSLSWHLSALHTTPDTNFVKRYGILYANIALNYNALGKRDSAFYYIRKAIACSRLYENLFALSNSLAIQAQLLVNNNQAAAAEPSLQEVVKIRKKIGDPFYIMSDMAQLGLYYAHNGQPEKGVAICREGIDIARRNHLETKLPFLYSTLAENYKAAGNLQAYAEVLEDLIDIKDSVFRMNSAEALAAIQNKYDLQKKENTIIQQKFDLTRKNYLLYGSLIIMALAAIALYFVFQDYRRRQKMKMLLIVETEKQLSEKAVMQAQENERKRIAADLHDNLGAYAASIASNLDQIEAKGSNGGIALKELRNNSQAIVSQLNDTIWVLKKDALSLTAISDRLKVFIQRLQVSYPLIKMDVVEQIETDFLLPAAQAFHLFQILQEAINNAVRHSGGRQVTVTIESNEQWTITVSDDGSGLPPVRKEGNGLLNIRNRSQESGWNIAWTNIPEGGTAFSIHATTN